MSCLTKPFQPDNYIESSGKVIINIKPKKECKISLVLLRQDAATCLGEWKGIVKQKASVR